MNNKNERVCRAYHTWESLPSLETKLAKQRVEEEKGRAFSWYQISIVANDAEGRLFSTQVRLSGEN